MTSAFPYWRLAGVYFSYFAFVGAFHPYLGLYLQALGQSAWHIGLLVAAMQLLRIVAANFWAWRADREGRREATLRFAAALGAAAWCAMFRAHDVAQLAVVLAFVALFTGGVVPLAEAITVGHLRENLARYGSVRVWGSVGFIVAVLGVGALLDRITILALPWAVFATLVALLGFAFAMPLTSHPRARRGDSVLPMLVRPEIALFLGSAFLMQVAHGPLYTFFSIYLADHGYSKTAVGVLWSLGVVAEIGAFLVMPRLLGRFGPWPILVASFSAAALRFAVLGWAVESPAVIALAQLLHGATFGIHHAACFAVVSRWFPGARHTRGQGLYLSISFGAGGMVGGLASGAAWTLVGPAWTFTLAAAAAIAGLALLVPRRRALAGPAAVG